MDITIKCTECEEMLNLCYFLCEIHRKRCILRFKFASIKHILNNHQNDQNKMFELLEEVSRDLKNYDLEFRIEELESKFSKDLSESTFNEIRELKKQKNIN